MARKTYSQEFRRQAVELYESTPGATFKGIASDLGISRETLADWVRELGAGDEPARTPPAAVRARADADRRPPDEPPEGRAGGGSSRGGAGRIARLQAQVAALEAEEQKLANERDLLRQSAKYVAEETNW